MYLNSREVTKLFLGLNCNYRILQEAIGNSMASYEFSEFIVEDTTCIHFRQAAPCCSATIIFCSKAADSPASILPTSTPLEEI